MPALSPLGRYLQARWAELGIRQAEFARRIGTLSSTVYLLKTGQRKPPFKELARWAKALELQHQRDRDRLLELMRLGHSLIDIQEAYEEMRAKIAPS